MAGITRQVLFPVARSVHQGMLSAFIPRHQMATESGDGGTPKKVRTTQFIIKKIIPYRIHIKLIWMALWILSDYDNYKLLIFFGSALREKRVPKLCPWDTIATNSTLFPKGSSGVRGFITLHFHVSYPLCHWGIEIVPLRVPYYGQSNSATRGTVLVPFFLSVLFHFADKSPVGGCRGS